MNAHSISLTMNPKAAPGEGAASVQSYRLAGHVLTTDVPLPELAPYAVKRQHVVFAASPECLPVEPSSAELIYEGPGWIGNQWRDVECRRSPAGFWLSVAGAGQFCVAPDGRTAARVNADLRTPDGVLTETAVGPVFILALALQGVWCLHASAARLREHTVAFIGESGSGKSTLAAFLDAEQPGDWRRVADDILPVRKVQQHLLALPRYPQLKLPHHAQPSLRQPGSVPLEAIYVLEECSRWPTSEIKIAPLGAREAALALVANTVAARLFDGNLLAQHVTFCARTAARTAVRRLCYRHEFGLLGRVRKLLEADLRVA